MTREPSVLLLEFNELCPALMDRWIGEGKLPNFQTLRAASQVYTTDAEETEANLAPEIQWITVHSGLSYSEHRIFHLSEGHALSVRCLWDLLSEHNRRVWVCGSMNARYDATLSGALLPDPWSDLRPYPHDLTPYYHFVKQYVLEHTNEKIPLGFDDYRRFLTFLMSHGLSGETARAITKQLIVERWRGNRWKRATILDKLQFDVFSWYYKRIRPHFATFFVNSTAHYQHMYWRHMEPQLFKVRPTTKDQAKFGNAILFGYQEMDRLVARFVDLLPSDAAIVLCTGLSQQPSLNYEDQGGKGCYRPRDFATLLTFAGIVAQSVSPLMAEEFHLNFTSEGEARQAATTLGALRVGDRRVFRTQVEGNHVFSKCCIFEPLPSDADMMNERDQKCPFFRLFYRVGIKSGVHHPEGMLWIRAPGEAHRIYPGVVSLRTIAPTILGMFSLPKPAYMQARPLFGSRR
jgi:hypothetical protein